MPDTTFTNKILLVQWTASQLKDSTISDTAKRIRQSMPNVSGVMLKVINGKSWQGAGRSDLPHAITGVRRIEEWVDAFGEQGLEVHAWGVPRGKDRAYLDGEIEMYARVAQIPGIASISFDVEHDPPGAPVKYYWVGGVDLARDLMRGIRESSPDTTHLGLILDGRRNRSFAVWVDPFIPYIDSLHPMVYPILFGSWQSINDHLNDAFNNLALYNKPIIPMLQSFLEAGIRPTTEEITEQGNAAFSRGATGVSFYRMGDFPAADGIPHMGENECKAIAAIQRPGQTENDDTKQEITYTWQDMINAIVTVALRHNAVWQDWFNGAGLGQMWAESLRNEAYSGPPLAQWAMPDKAMRKEIFNLLALGTNKLAEVTADTQEERQKEATEKRRKSDRPIIGIHGAPGVAAPPRHLWDQWIGMLKDMGVAWYKQCDFGDPNDTGDGSVFRWVLRLRDEGITPIVRYLMSEQFPDTLPEHYFKKMELFAKEGVTWAEIGNEPNLHIEWKGNWHPQHFAGNPNFPMRHTNPEVIRIIAQCWVTDAEKALNAGVRPAFYAFAPTDWNGGSHPQYSSVFFVRKVVRYLSEHFRQRTIDIFKRGGWIAVHAATYEQPDNFNPFTNSNAIWDMTLRSYEITLNAFRNYFSDALNVDDIVVMSTEGGVFTPESTSMNGHNRLRSNQEHAERVISMYKWLEANSPLQAMCPWCISVGPAIGHFNAQFQFDGWIEEFNGQLNPRPVYHALVQLRQEREREQKTKTLLNVPYHSQWDAIASTHLSDCGPTCIAMILNAQPSDKQVTVDELYTHIPHKIDQPGAFTTLDEMWTIGHGEGVQFDGRKFTEETGIAEARKLIEAGTPFIALVNYKYWNDIAQNNFENAHFVVVVGIDDEFIYVHDPLFRLQRRSMGQNFAWTHEQFLLGWGKSSELGNPNYHALIPHKTVAQVT